MPFNLRRLVTIAAVASIGEVLSRIGPTYGDTVDWSAAERVYGTSFPADYRAYVAAFGSGSIEETLISSPAAVVKPESPRPADHQPTTQPPSLAMYSSQRARSIVNRPFRWNPPMDISSTRRSVRCRPSRSP